MKLKAVIVIIALLLIVRRLSASSNRIMSDVNVIDQAKEFLRKKEGFIKKAMWDVNAWRIGYGSDTIVVNSDGMFRTVKEGDVTTQPFAEIDLARRIQNEFIPKIKKRIGGDEVWNKLPSGMKVALISFAYNYGNIVKKAIVDAVKNYSGNTQLVADAWIKSTYDDNKRLPERTREALRNRRKDEVALFHK